MPEKDGFEPGQFCWIDLGTTDPVAAKAFYGTLFGWTTEDAPAEGHGPYTMFSAGGRQVGGMYALMKEQLDGGVPPHWMSYVAVASADEAAATAKELGGSVVLEPQDVMDAGRMAVIGDPTNAMFAVWESGAHCGMGLVGEIGSPCWFELATRDASASGPFFAKLFGWTPEDSPMGDVAYTMFRHGEGHVGGMMPMTEEWGDTPSHWMIYFTVADCDAVCAKIGALGGGVCVPPTDIEGIGRFAVVNDPQGAYFSVITLLDAKSG